MDDASIHSEEKIKSQLSRGSSADFHVTEAVYDILQAYKQGMITQDMAFCQIVNVFEKRTVRIGLTNVFKQPPQSPDKKRRPIKQNFIVKMFAWLNKKKN